MYSFPDPTKEAQAQRSTLHVLRGAQLGFVDLNQLDAGSGNLSLIHI